MVAFGDLLQGWVKRARIGSQTLSKLTGIPRTSIDNWRGGIARPKHWRPLLQIAHALALSRSEVDELLEAAGHPPVATLAREIAPDHPDWVYLQPWPDKVPAGLEDVEHRLQALEAQRNAPVPPAISPRHQLRTPLRDFVGHSAAITTLLAILRGASDGRAIAAISSIQGMGGIGKTELAYLVANQLCDTFPDAQIVLDLHGSNATQSPPERALQQVIQAFTGDEPHPTDLSTLQQRYRSVLYGKRALILADDARNAAQVRPLLPPPGCALLVTSRARFTLPGMTTIDLEPLTADEASTLLRGICPRLSVVEAQALAQACGQLPLALRVSGGILRNDPAVPVATYLSRLMDTRQRLMQLRDPDDGQLDVEASLALSYRQLDAVSQQVFRQLGVLMADFNTTMAQAVVAAPADVDIEALLHLLLRRNLVMYDVERARWRLHDLVRDLAQRKLEATGETEAAYWRYAQAAVQIAHETQAQYLTGGNNVLAALARFDIERPHIDAARVWATSHATTVASDTLLVADARATYVFGELRYDWRHEYIPHLETALSAARRLGDRQGIGAVLDRLGSIYRMLGDAGRAITYLKEHRASAQESGDRLGEWQAHNNLGLTYDYLGDLRGAIRAYERAIAIAQAITYRRGEGSSLCNLGLAYLNLGDPERAVAILEPALALFREVGARRGEATALCNLVAAYRALGDSRRALACGEQALAIARALEDRYDEAITLRYLGCVYTDLGEAQQAIESCERSLDLLREIGDQREEGYALCALGAGHAALSDRANAQPVFEEALAVFRAVGDRRGEAACGWAFGLTLTDWGERAQALPLLRVAVAYEHEIEHARAAEHTALLARLEAGMNLPPDLLRPRDQRAVGDDPKPLSPAKSLSEKPHPE